MTRILVVDDKDYNLISLNRILTKDVEDVQVYLADDPKKAEGILMAEPIDIVITDLIITTESSGIDILEMATRKDPLIMVIIVTAYHSLLDRAKAFEKGAFDCILRAENLDFRPEIVVKTKNAIIFRENTLKLIEAEKKQLESVKEKELLEELGRFFDPIVFGKYKDKKASLTPQKKFVTIVFWDIRGFSLLSEILIETPEIISGFLREYFEVAANIINKNNGVLDKFIGDGVMAIFGAFREIPSEEEYEQDALLAARAAWSLKIEFEKLYAKWREIWEKRTGKLIEIGLGCGIHSGFAIVGNSGTLIRDHFTAVGANVNLAARVEGLSLASQIIITSTTKAYLKDSFKYDKLEPHLFKNIPFKVPIFNISSVYDV